MSDNELIINKSTQHFTLPFTKIFIIITKFTIYHNIYHLPQYLSFTAVFTIYLNIYHLPQYLPFTMLPLRTSLCSLIFIKHNAVHCKCKNI